jgi:hypothetical protein
MKKRRAMQEGPMMKSLLLLLIATVSAHAQDVTLPPASAQLRYTLSGVGVQIYACTAGGKWVLQEPQADLIDPKTKAHVGTHSKGPIWTWSDGSILLGEVLKQQPSATSIPWLLLSVLSTGKRGALTDIAYVRRSDTQGGLVPASVPCGAADVDEVLRVPYAATYTFYTK